MKIISVDIGGTNIRHALVDSESLSILYRAPNIPTPRDNVRALCEAVTQGIESIARDIPDNKTVVAISSAGLVCPLDGSVIALSPEALPALAVRLPLKQIIKENTGASICILNDAQAATYGEFIEAKKQRSDLENFMYATVSTGTGGGFVLNGKLLRGKTGKAGHIGLTMLCDDTLVEDVTCGRYINQDPEKTNISADIIAKMIANKVIELDLDAVSIGGGVALGMTGYVDMVRQKLATFGDAYQTGIYQATLGDDAGLVGAAAYALHSMEC